MGINKNFVVRNGLEVADNLFYVDDVNTKVGVKTANPDQDFHVRGSTKLEGSIVSAGNTTGVLSQYLRSTGDGWEWASFPISRQSAKFTLTTGQTRVPATGTFGLFTLTEDDLTSVYLDGVKLTSGSLKDYVIDVGGGSITLSAAAFGGEEIEIIAHGASGIGAGTTGILGVTARKAGIDSGSTGQIRIFDFVGLGVTLDGRSGLCTVHIDSGGLTDVSGDPTPILGGNLDLDSNDIIGTGNINITGIITATSFSGIGSDITGISTLNITNYGAGLGGGANVAGLFGKLNNDSAVGIFTDSAAVGLGTTNPRFQTEIGAVGAAGTQLWVNGDARITGILTVGSSSITLDGTNDEIRIGTALTLTSSGAAQYTGVVTASGFDGDLVGQHKVFTAGVSNSDDYDIALFLDPTQGGHTFNRYDLGGKLQYNPSTGQLSNIGIVSATGQIISGVTTHQGEVNFQSNVNFGDNDIINVGSGNDLQISHTGALSRIQEVGDGGLEFRANPSITIGQYGTTEEMASFRVGAGVSLFYNNSKKFETTPNGTYVTGISSAVSFSGNALSIPQDTNAYGDVKNITVGNDLKIYSVSGYNNIVTDEYPLLIGVEVEDGGPVTRAKFGLIEVHPENDVYYGNNSHVNIGFGTEGTKLNTTGAGVSISGICSAASFSGSGIGLTGMVDVADGTYGGSTVSPQITVADGRITGITATLISGGGGGGTEVIIEDNDSLVGTAGTINFDSGLSVTPASAGVVTVTATSAEVINDTTPQLGGNLDLNSRTINGTGNINVNGSFRFSGITTFTSDVEVHNGRVESNSFVVWNDDLNDEAWRIFHSNSVLDTGNGNAPIGNGLFFSPQETANPQDGIYFQTKDSSAVSQRTLVVKDDKVGIGTTNATEKLTVVGNVTATAYYGDGSNLTGVLKQESDTLADVVSRGSSAGAGINFGANQPISFETASNNDFQIYGSSNQKAYITHVQNNGGGGAGDLVIVARNGVNLYGGTAETAANLGLEVVSGYTNLYHTGDLKLQTTSAGVSVTGALNVSGISSATAESGSFTASSGVAYTANTYDASSFANAEYTLFFQHSSGIQSQKVLVMDDGTTAYSQEYGIMYSNDLLVSVGATIRSGNVELEWTPETGVSGIVTFKYSRDMLI